MGRESHVYGVSVCVGRSFLLGLRERRLNGLGLYAVVMLDSFSIYCGSSCLVVLRSNLPNGIDGTGCGKLLFLLHMLPTSPSANFFFS